MEHLDNEIRCVSNEIRWGTILGVMQSDADRTIGALRGVLGEINTEMESYKQSCVERGIDFANDAKYRRYHHLYAMFGGIYYCMQGSDGMMSGLVTDLLSDVEF